MARGKHWGILKIPQCFYKDWHTGGTPWSRPPSMLLMATSGDLGAGWICSLQSHHLCKNSLCLQVCLIKCYRSFSRFTPPTVSSLNSATANSPAYQLWHLRGASSPESKQILLLRWGAEGMESAHQLLLNLENNYISLFQRLLLKDRHTWAVPTLQPHFAGTKPPPGVPALGYGEREPWIHNHSHCYRVQTLCNGKTSPLLFQNYYFFLFKGQAEQ